MLEVETNEPSPVRAVLLAVLLAVVFRILMLNAGRLSRRVVRAQTQAQLPRAQRAQLTQQIRHTLHTAGAVTLTGALQALLSLH